VLLAVDLHLLRYNQHLSLQLYQRTVKMDKPQHPYMMASQSDDEVTESSSAVSLLHDEPQSRNYTSLRLKSRRTGLIWLLHAALLSTSAMFLITGILARRGDTGRCAGDWCGLFCFRRINPDKRVVG
jgi:hypothetical protein